MSLSGDWYHELGSKMILNVDGRDVTGQYWTAVGDATGSYELSGRTNTENTIVGFAVAWQNSYGDNESATSWSGQYHGDEDVLITTWLLTEQTDDTNDWKSTVVGKDTFQRQPPTEELVRHASRFRVPSHPTRLPK